MPHGAREDLTTNAPTPSEPARLLLPVVALEGDTWAITIDGVCPDCGCRSTISMLGMTGLPELALGGPWQAVKCMVCKHEIPMRVMGVTLTPFAPRLDEDDEEPEEED